MFMPAVQMQCRGAIEPLLATGTRSAKTADAKAAVGATSSTTARDETAPHLPPGSSMLMDTHHDATSVLN